MSTLSAVLGIGQAIFKAVTSIVTKAVLSTAFERTKVVAERIGPQTLRSHRRELSSALGRMPFIYKDLTTEVLRDFAEISTETVNLLTLEPVHEPSAHTTTLARIANKRKALFVGNAGIGKTTFFRYTVLSLLASRQGVVHFFPKEDLVPFYIPLKVIHNTRPFPVLSYILTNYRYASGPGGRRRLLQLAKKRRLFLLLDGYDETYVPPSNQTNFLLIELNILFTGKIPPYWLNTLNTTEFREIYDELRSCRIWLSSRREFYSLHSLELLKDGITIGMLDVVAVGLKGLHNRSLLATKIFDIYRNRNTALYGGLSEEVFLQDIDLAGDDDLSELSFSPLFLTVLCYIHAQGFGRPDKSRADYRQATMSDLILTCIDLLLTDLDEERIRDVPLEWREVLSAEFKRRRLLYSTEKREFLGFFANHILATNLQTFDVNVLSTVATDFFRKEYRSGYADEILRSLTSTSMHKSAHTFIRQLLNQGFFILVPTPGAVRLYDFPHRRFREVLAAQYLNRPDRVSHVLENLGNPQYAEFVYVFFSVSQYQSQILEALLERADASEQGQSYGILATNCLHVRPKHYDPTPVLINWLRKRSVSQIAFRIPVRVLDYLLLSKETGIEFLEIYRRAINDGDKHIMAVLGPALLAFNRVELALLLLNSFPRAIENKSLASTFLYFLAKVDEDQILSRIEELRTDLGLFRSLAVVYATLGDEVDGGSFWRLIAEKASFEQAVVLADVLQRYNKNLLEQFNQNKSLAEDLEILAIATQYLREMDEDSLKGIADSAKVLEPFYVVTSAILLKVEDAATKEMTLKLMGAVRKENDFLQFRGRFPVKEASRQDPALLKRAAQILMQLPLHEEAVASYFY